MNCVKQNNNQINSVKTLISNIKVMYYNNDPMLNGVEDMNSLYNALCDLDEIVGMYEVKDSIVKQIKFLLVNYSISDKKKFDGHMLHTVIFGPPGVGKTTIGICLANVWKGLGLVEKKLINDKKQINQKNIRILPIPIFLMKNNKQNNEEFDETKENNFNETSEDKTQNSPNENIFNLKDLNVELKSEKEENKEKKCTVIKKRKLDKREINLNYKMKELKEELELISYRGKDSLDDKRKYVKELSENRRKMRAIKLLSFGIKNINRPMEHVNIKPLTRHHKTEIPIKIVSRPDFVGQYVGHTCDKTQKLLSNTLEEGKVLFIDEAYSIVLDEKDSFGHEALNELNRFMSEHPELVVIFAGYKDKMESTLFKYQPGFKRRCTWMFEISDYTGQMLSDIFKKQLVKDDWQYEGSDKDLSDFFQLKIKNFDAFGGDTIRLVFYCKLKFSELKFNFEFRNKLKDKTITFNIVKNAYDDIYCKNKPEKIEDDDVSWKRMFV